MRLFIALMALLINSILALPASAEEAGRGQWSLFAGSGSYMGETHWGLQYVSGSRKHATSLSYGQTPGDLGNDVAQINLKYIYSPFQFAFKEIRTNGLGLGLLAARWQSDSAFIESPSQYPSADYYSPTRWRFGLVLEQTWTYRSLGFYLNWVLLDQAAIALYNNEKFIEGTSPWGGGFGVRWDIY